MSKHPKDIVKSAIYDMIRQQGRVHGSDLRARLVEEQSVCSKSSLYRLLEELEKEGLVESVEQGRDKIFVNLSSEKSAGHVLKPLSENNKA